MLFLVLDLTFDLVLGTPWLTATNLRMDWARRTIAVQVKGRWIALPTLAHGKLCAAMSKGRVGCRESGARQCAESEESDGVS